MALALTGITTPARADVASVESDLLNVAGTLQDKAMLDYQNGPNPGSLSTAFGSISINVPDHRVDIYWKGHPTQELADALESRTNDVLVQVHKTPYSLADIELAKEILVTLLESMGTTNQAQVSSMVDNSAIKLQVSSSTSLSAVEKLLDAFHLVSGTPVEISFADYDTSGLTTRPADSSPYSGGALIGIGQQQFAGYCSSGFGVKSATSGVNYILTANHCFHAYSSSSYTSANVFSGTNAQGIFDGHTTVGTWQNTTGYNKPTLDLAVYRPSSGVSANTIYTGSVSSNSKVTISKAMNPVVGETVCTSGGMSGAHCDLSVDSVNGMKLFVNADQTTFTISSNLATAHSLSNGIAVAAGDSGGPVYDYQSGSYAGLGIITGGDGIFNCPVISYKCFTTVYFTQLPLDLSTINMTLR
jgi:hypothetical protein